VFARVSEWSVPPERQDEALRAAEELIGPALSKQPGSCGDLLLGDRHSGKMLTVTPWEDEQAMHATDEASHWFRSYGAWQTGGRPRAQAATRSTVPRTSGVKVSMNRKPPPPVAPLLWDRSTRAPTL
jgi:hypothetical protein